MDGLSNKRWVLFNRGVLRKLLQILVQANIDLFITKYVVGLQTPVQSIGNFLNLGVRLPEVSPW